MHIWKKKNPSVQGAIFKRRFCELEALAKIHKEPTTKDLSLEQEESQATLMEINSIPGKILYFINRQGTIGNGK